MNVKREIQNLSLAALLLTGCQPRPPIGQYSGEYCGRFGLLERCAPQTGNLYTEDELTCPTETFMLIPTGLRRAPLTRVIGRLQDGTCQVEEY